MGKLEYKPPQLKQRLEGAKVLNINTVKKGHEQNIKDCIKIYEFNETSEAETPVYRLPWPRSKKQRTSNEPEKFSSEINATGNENVPHKACSDLDQSSPSNSFGHFLGPRVEALVLRQNVEVIIVPSIFPLCPGLN